LNSDAIIVTILEASEEGHQRNLIDSELGGEKQEHHHHHDHGKEGHDHPNYFVRYNRDFDIFCSL
jgi:hypothetical protein